MTELDRWQQPDNGFPTLDYFKAVAGALEAAGIRLEDWHNDEGWVAAFAVDRDQIDPDGGVDKPQRGAFLAWRCGEDDDPKHADDFTGQGWFWCPCTDADQRGDYLVSLSLSYLAEPADVAAAFLAVLRAEYEIEFTRS